MPLRVISTASGPAALDALADVVRDLKGGDPLRPVTVVVPTNTAGVMARRALGRRGGATAVDALTLYRVAELLGGRPLVDGGRRPVSTPVVDLAIEQVLTADPGSYAEVASHPSTVVALRTLYREVRLAGPPARAALASSERGGEPARVIEAVDAVLRDRWYDEGELLVRAAAVVRAGVPARFERLVLHLPQRVRPLEVELLRALGARGEVVLLVALTGDPDADAGFGALLADLDVAGDPAIRPELRSGPVAKHGIEVVSTTDADDEVRIATRALVDAARAGTSFDRIAVVWPSDRPYARLVEHHLTAADVPWNGRPGTIPAERLVPRLLAALLDLDRRGLRRFELMHLLSDVPARAADGRPVPIARWDRIGRSAAIVREEDWGTRLPAWIDEAQQRHPDLVEAAGQLQAFVAELRDALGEPDRRLAWSSWAAWAHGRIERWFGRRTLDSLDGAERSAWELAQQVLDRLSNLDALSGPVTRADFRAMFVAELDVAPARAGRVGDGVHVGALAGSAGLDVDLVVVLGGAEGLLPPAPAVDPLVGDLDRGRAGLVTADERTAELRRQFLAIVHGTPSVVITVPRGNLRATSVHHPSRWVTALLDAGMADTRSVDSHAHGLSITEFPVSPAEHRARELWTRLRSGEDVHEHPLVVRDQVLGRALRLRDARASDRFTVYDGDLSARRPAVFDRPVSPTSIEAWSACPHAYFMHYLLGVRPIEEPGDILTLTALDRGSALHTAIDRLQRAVLDGRVPMPGADGWTADHAAELARLGEEVAAELELAGRTGRSAYWVSARAELLAELARWIDVDRRQWNGRTLRSSEQSFGGDDDTPTPLTLPDGRAIAFHGQIDRIDELADGTIVVTDHKTGKSRPYKGLTAVDPTVGGTRFQLPVYAAAARVLLERPDATVHAEYAFFATGNFTRIGVTFEPTTWELVGVQLAEVVDGIEGGIFPPTPDPPKWRHPKHVGCEYCEPDLLGTAPRWAEWNRKRHDPRLARWFADPETNEHGEAAS